MDGPHVSERARLPEREYVHDGVVPLPGRGVYREPFDWRRREAGDGAECRQLGRFQTAVLLGGAHRPRELQLCRRDVCDRSGGFGLYKKLLGTHGTSVRCADDAVRHVDILRSEQICRAVERC